MVVAPKPCGHGWFEETGEGKYPFVRYGYRWCSCETKQVEPQGGSREAESPEAGSWGLSGGR